MKTVILAIVAAVQLVVLAVAARIVSSSRTGVLFRFGRVIGERAPGFRVIDQIAQTTLRKIVGQLILDQTLSETDKINLDIRKILDGATVKWGVQVTLEELKDIQLPESMKRAMARQAEAERKKPAKIINAEGESLAAATLGDVSDTMMAHPLALQLRNLQSLVEIGVNKNTTLVFPAPLMTSIAELGAFLALRVGAAGAPTPYTLVPVPPAAVAPDGNAVLFSEPS